MYNRTRKAEYNSAVTTEEAQVKTHLVSELLGHSQREFAPSPSCSHRSAVVGEDSLDPIDDGSTLGLCK